MAVKCDFYISSGRVIDRHAYGIDAVIVDCVTFSETGVRQMTGNNTDRKKSHQQNRESLASNRRAFELSAVEGCLQRESLLPVSKVDIKVVTIDWVVNCLQVPYY